MDANRIDHWRAAIKADTFGRYRLEMGVAILRHDQDVAVALDHLRQAVALKPSLVEAQLLLVETLTRLGHTEEGTRADRDAMAVEPDYRVLGLCWRILRALSDKDPGLAERELATLRNLAPDRDETRALTALLQMEQGEVPSPPAFALPQPSELSMAIGGAFTAVGHLWRDRGQPDRAEPAFRAALACDSDELAAHIGMVGILKRRSDWVGVCDHLRHCQTLAPYDLNHPFERGNILFDQPGRSEEAAECYRAVLAIDPTHAAARIRLRRIPLLNGRIDDTIAMSREAIAATPENCNGLKRELALYLCVGHHWPEAVTLLETLRPVYANDANHRSLEALAALALGQIPAAHAHIDAILATNPQDLRCTSTLGLTMLLEGDVTAANELTRQALARARIPDASGRTPGLRWCLIVAGIVAEASRDTSRADTLAREAVETEASQVWLICRLFAPFWDLLEPIYERIGFTQSGIWPATT